MKKILKKVTLQEDEVVIRKPDLMRMLERAYKEGVSSGEMMVGDLVDIMADEFDYHTP